VRILFNAIDSLKDEIIMDEYFEICGNRIPYSGTTAFHIEQREYIYRPVYKEKESSVIVYTEKW
jgi:hypothetical protein